MTAFSKSDFRPPPTNVVPPPEITSPGVAEIKAHNWDGISKGLENLSKHPSSARRVLITYRPRDNSGGAVNKGQPLFVDIYAIDFSTIPSGIKGPVDLLQRGSWWHVDRFASPSRIRLTVDNRSLYGSWVEQYVRAVFNTRMLKPSKRKMLTPLRKSGEKKGPDVQWQELAEFYGELGRMAGDPFYAELASELASLR